MDYTQLRSLKLVSCPFRGINREIHDGYESIVKSSSALPLSSISAYPIFDMSLLLLDANFLRRPNQQSQSSSRTTEEEEEAKPLFKSYDKKDIEQYSLCDAIRYTRMRFLLHALKSNVLSQIHQGLRGRQSRLACIQIRSPHQAKNKTLRPRHTTEPVEAAIHSQSRRQIRRYLSTR